MMVLITSCEPKRAFSIPGIAPQIPPPTICRDETERNQNATADRFAKRNSDPRRCKRANIKLAFSTDVEQAATKSDQHGEPGEDQRRRIEECVADTDRP